MWLSGIELGTLGRAGNALNHLAISPAPVLYFLRSLLGTRHSLHKTSYSYVFYLLISDPLDFPPQDPVKEQHLLAQGRDVLQLVREMVLDWPFKDVTLTQPDSHSLALVLSLPPFIPLFLCYIFKLAPQRQICSSIDTVLTLILTIHLLTESIIDCQICLANISCYLFMLQRH